MLPTLLDLGIQKGQGVNHLFQARSKNSMFCLCGKEQFSGMHGEPAPKVKKVKPWIKNHIRTITDPDEIQAFLESKKNDRRLGVFHAKGLKCIVCDRVGTKIVEYQDDPNNRRSIHHDLFTEDGIMMTIDHTLPKSLGGSNDLTNLEPMCGPHNWAKGNNPDYEFQETK